MPDSAVITRFAPSPTGHLHVGGARTALFCWAYAKRHGGRFVLRIEDTDQKRSSEAAVGGILADLAWLGIDWQDGPELEGFGGDDRGVGPYYQAQRLDLYNAAVQTLLDAQLAYPAFETEADIAALRAEAEKNKDTFRYRRDAVTPDYDHAAATERMKTEEHVIRFCMPTEPVEVVDDVLGTIEFGEEHTDDFVIRKKDGFPTYHLAVVVDDELMGVTHILRGQEHLQNTPRHVALQLALGYRTPTYAHLPLIFNPDGSKMSKRDKDKAARAACKDAGVDSVSAVEDGRFAEWLKDKKSQLETGQLLSLASELSLELPEIDVEDFRRSGYLPEVLVNYLALLGWNPGMKTDDGKDLERFDEAFLAEHFAFDRLGKSASKFDREKLAAFNQDTINTMEPAEFAERWHAWLAQYEPDVLAQFGERFAVVAEAIQPRAKTFRHALEPAAFILTEADAIAYDAKAVKKVLLKGEPSGLAVLQTFLDDRFGAIEPFAPQAIDDAVAQFCEDEGLGMGKIAQPLRVAMTGTSVSPGVGHTLASVGKDEARRRIERCLSHDHAKTVEAAGA